MSGSKLSKNHREAKRCWIYGHHAVLSALKNNTRVIHRVLLLGDSENEIKTLCRARGIACSTSFARDAFVRSLGPGQELVVHQNIAAEIDPVRPLSLFDLLKQFSSDSPCQLVLLDQVSDPQNLGSIFRAAAVFGLQGLIVPSHHAAPLTAATFKAASGGIEHVAYCVVPNLAQCLVRLKEEGFWVLGFDEGGSRTPATLQVDPSVEKLVFVLGAEGAGIRPLVKKQCDFIVRLPHFGGLATLNVAQAACVAFYAVSTLRKEKNDVVLPRV